jgi:uncharacterized membrane protein YoaK (UPF0700 family)
MSWERRYAFLLGLTGAAGALDALSFLYLGKVFTSFQSGNVLFIGMGLGQGNGGLVLRAGAALAAFFVGIVGGARLIGARLRPAATRLELVALAIEGALLLAFAVLWLAIGNPHAHPGAREVLLALAGCAMGVQGALGLALKIPNVVTVALTATVAYLGQRAGAGSEARPEGVALPSSGLLAALILMYVACAFLVAVLPDAAALSLAPLVVLTVGVALDRQSRVRILPASTDAARSSRSSAAT